MVSASGLVITKIQDVTVVSFRNTSILDAAAVESIARELYPLVDEQAIRKIILDFDEVRFLSSQMLGVLIALHRKCEQIKGRIVVCGIRPELKKVFQIMKLDKILDFVPSEEHGLNIFGVSTKPG